MSDLKNSITHTEKVLFFPKKQEELYNPAKKAGGRHELPGKIEQNCKQTSKERQNKQGNSFSISNDFSASGPATVMH